MNAPKTRNENIVVQEMEKEILIYDLKDDKALCLNEMSALIYQLCDGKNSVAEINQALNKTLNQSISEDLIWLALNDFKRDNLLEEGEWLEIDFSGLSRRQVIRKVGLASLIMLPVISSVVAPVSAAAASLAPLLAFCSSSAQCQSGNCDTNVVPRRCCVPGSSGIRALNFCCADPPSCNLSCCTGTGTNIIAFAPCAGFGGLRVTCP